jgi:soluble lytic murein transglycosylase-like protein
MLRSFSKSAMAAAFALVATVGAWAKPVPGVSSAIPNAPDCLDEAAAFHRVNPWVLRAIIWQESGNRPGVVVRNTNGSVDVGLGQINSVHYRELGLYNVAPAQLLDSCVNTYVAAWLLAKKMKAHGNTWEAVGAYHSETPAEKWLYVNRIQAILARWQAVESMQGR